MFQGAIFDLDGVIVNTVPLHFKAWERMFTEYGQSFTFEDYKKKVDGIPRTDGARAILTDLTDDELKKACDKKQGYYLEYLKQDKVPLYPETIDLIRELRSKSIKVAVISSSKNTPYILDSIGLTDKIETKIDGNDITKGKPDPQIFLMAAEKLGLSPKTCVVFEDAVLGVEAAKRAGMFCVGIDRHNDPAGLKNADIIVKNLKEINYRQLKELFNK